jgi:tetrahydromethanopterin S-methyltransferase subunit G
MTEPTAQPTDPFEPMRRSYEEALDNWSTMMEQMVGAEGFASASNQLLKQYVEIEKSIRETSRATADALHIPTKDDVAQVAEQIGNVERKVDEVSSQGHGVADLVERLPVEGLAALPGRLLSLETKIDALSAAAADPADDELSGIAERLVALETKLDAVREVIPPAPADPADALAPILARLGSLESKVDALATAPKPAASKPARGKRETAKTDEAQSRTGDKAPSKPASPARRRRTPKS